MKIIVPSVSSQCLYLWRRGWERPDQPGEERRGHSDRYARPTKRPADE